jgi:hypothetical protein
LERLREMGHELRRPEADFLRDGIYELRVSLGGVHHRILYFFHGAIAAVVSHGLVKERVVPPKEIDHAGRGRLWSWALDLSLFAILRNRKLPAKPRRRSPLHLGSSL